MAHKREVNEVGPNGGVRCELTFFDDKMSPVDEDDATQSICTEFDEDGNEVARTYVVIPPKADRTPIK